MSDVLPDNCVWGATRKPARCRSATSKSGFPIMQVSSCAQHPSNALKLPVTTVCLPSDHVVQIQDGQCLSNKRTHHHLGLWSTHPCFFWSRRPFPHPQRRLHLGFNIIPTNPRLISWYDVLKKVFITICIGKQFLTDSSTILFLIASQQTRHEFCTDATHWSFSVQNLMARSYADAHFVSNFSDVKRRLPRITARTLSTWSSFDVEGRPGLGSSPTDIPPSLKRLNHS